MSYSERELFEQLAIAYRTPAARMHPVFWVSNVEQEPYLFMGRQIPSGDHWEFTWEGGKAHALRMYGIDFDTPEPLPEKSPIDKAIDDMMAKRKAKRENAEADADVARANGLIQEQLDDWRSHELGRAMRRPGPHDLTVTERLAPWKVVRG